MIVELTYQFKKPILRPDGGDFAGVTLQFYERKSNGNIFKDGWNWSFKPERLVDAIRAASLRALDEIGATGIQVVLTDFKFTDVNTSREAAETAARNCVLSSKSLLTSQDSVRR